jgi:hypothetical protein
VPVAQSGLSPSHSAPGDGIDRGRSHTSPPHPDAHDQDRERYWCWILCSPVSLPAGRARLVARTKAFCPITGCVPTALLLTVGSADRIPCPGPTMVLCSRPCSSRLPTRCASSVLVPRSSRAQQPVFPCLRPPARINHRRPRAWREPVSEPPVRYQDWMVNPARFARESAMRIMTAVTRPITPASAG